MEEEEVGNWDVLGKGLVGVTYVCMVLMVAMAVAAAVGVGLVSSWAEEPVFVRDTLYFDYTQPHPTAVFSLAHCRVPVAHTFQVSLLLLLPDSYFNRDIGVFQLRAELMSGNTNVIAKSSQPCMLRYTSLPIRLARTFVKVMPILLGISRETQTMAIEMLKHKEGYPRSEAVRVTLIPRAGAQYNLPQLYEAEIIITSQLPWKKQVVHNWKWTFYVWASLYLYTMVLLAMICCCKPILFPTHIKRPFPQGQGVDGDSATVERRRQSRRKRKAMYMQEASVESSAPSISDVTETMESAAVEEDEVGDSESIT